MKILLVIMTITAVLLGLAYFLGWLPSSTSPASPPTSSPPSTINPAPAPTPVTTPAPSLPPPPAPVGTTDFGFVITDISGSGLSRTITAETTNMGTADAHDVWAEVTVSSDDSVIKVNSQEQLRIDIGILPAGQTVTRQVTLSFGISDGLKIAQNGATFKMVIHSNEYTEVFLYDYQP